MIGKWHIAKMLVFDAVSEYRRALMTPSFVTTKAASYSRCSCLTVASVHSLCPWMCLP